MGKGTTEMRYGGVKRLDHKRLNSVPGNRIGGWGQGVVSVVPFWAGPSLNGL